jgi:hypothetical protein
MTTSNSEQTHTDTEASYGNHSRIRSSHLHYGDRVAPLRNLLPLNNSQSSIMGTGSRVFRAEMLLVRPSTSGRYDHIT